MVAEGLVYEGPPINDDRTLVRVPEALVELLRSTNGFIALRGGLHIRGACTAPAWHSLAAAWEGPHATHQGAVAPITGRHRPDHLCCLDG
jgi:hypothetical protein